MEHDHFYMVAATFARKPGAIINVGVVKKALLWSSEQAAATIEELRSTGDIEPAGGHFVRITQAGYERMTSYKVAAE